ncbi:hypothetical protein CGMCC3_g58 [Colletotrichum fructicola]|nr:uncharacterized protein CGMCC3_g58 [Colletotrichum fructicola]KAE9583690.1 hypothetical protein CGMCC3_g58 [Colletotrichum fructicola]
MAQKQKGRVLVQEPATPFSNACNPSQHRVLSITVKPVEVEAGISSIRRWAQEEQETVFYPPV